MNFNCNEFRVSIYGDGNREYDGYFLVVLDEFDECANPTDRYKAFYVEVPYSDLEREIDVVREFITHMIKTGMICVFDDYERIAIRKTWEMFSREN